MQPVRAVIFDLGGVVIDSPLHAIARYERELGLPARKAMVRVGPPLLASGRSKGSVLFRLVPEIHAGVPSEERLWPRSVITPEQLLTEFHARMLFTIWKTPPVLAMEPPSALPLLPVKDGFVFVPLTPPTAALPLSVKLMA